MSDQTALDEIFEHVSSKIRLEFNQNSIFQHSASKGAVREGVIKRDLLEKYVASIGKIMGSVEMLSTDGTKSPQCDLVVVDPGTPPLMVSEEYSLIPIECCFAVIEVKSNLNRGELDKCWKAADAIKSMPRTSYKSYGGSDPSVARLAHGRSWPHAFPVKYFVFAYGAIDLEDLAVMTSELAKDSPEPWRGIDAIVVLDAGVVTWVTGQGESLVERFDSSAVASIPAAGGKELMFMILTLNDLVNKSSYNDPVDLVPYFSTLIEGAKPFKDGLPAMYIPDLKRYAGFNSQDD